MAKKTEFSVADLVTHKARNYSYEKMIVVKKDGNIVTVRYWNDAQKKFTLQDLFQFELVEAKQER